MARMPPSSEYFEPEAQPPIMQAVEAERAQRRDVQDRDVDESAM